MRCIHKTMKNTPLIILASVAFAACCTAADHVVKFTPDDKKIAIEIDGKPFSNYFFNDGDGVPFRRPFFSPAAAADGTVVTADQTALKLKEHPHHRSIWVAHGDVNGADHWGLNSKTKDGKENKPKQNHIAFSKMIEDGFVEQLEWEDIDHKPMMKETRTVQILVYPDGSRAIDLKSEYTALVDVTFGSTKEAGLIAVRLVKELSKDENLSLSSGAKGMKACWGKVGKWGDISGQIDGKPYGVAIFDHPNNPKYPANWHIRDYGLMSPNSFGLHDFDKSVDAHAGELKIEKDKSVVFHYRVVIHATTAADAKLDEKWAEFAM